MEYHVVPIKGNRMLSPIKEQIVIANQSFGWTESQTLDDFFNPHSEYYCLVDKERLIGYISLHHVIDEVSINTVYIVPEERQKGLASQLLAYSLLQWQQRGVRNVFLEVRVSNEAAIRLYQSQGFIQLIKRSNYYQNPVEDALIMQKQLVEE